MIYIYTKHIVFKELVYLWFYSLRDLHYELKMVSHINPESEELYIILGANNVLINTPKNYIIIQLEQTKTKLQKIHFNNKYLELLYGAKEVFDYSQKNVEYFKEILKIKSHYVPLGYHTLLQKIPTSINMHKSIDILFFGSISERRDKILQTLGLRKKIRIVVRNNDLWGIERDNLIAKSKIILNIQCFEGGILEIPRINYLLHRKAFIVSEAGCEPDIITDWHNLLVLVNYKELINTCLYYLKNTSERIRMANIGYQHLITQPFSKNLKKIQPFLKKHIQNTVNEIKDVSKINEIKSSKKKIKKIKFFVPQPITEVETCLNLDKQYVLKLPEIEENKLPTISIVTPTGNRRKIFPLAIRNFMSFIYPHDKLEWIIVDDGEEEMEDLIPKDSRIKYYKLQVVKRMSIGKKRNYCVEKCNNKIIIHMDDDDFYTPENLLARVKCLLKYKIDGIECVGCSDVGTYELNQCLSSIGSNGKRFLTESSLCYYKYFWKKRKFDEKDTKGEYKYFLEYRQDQCKTIPFQFVTIALTHWQNTTENLRVGKGISSKNPNQDLLNFLAPEDQFYLLNLRKVLLKTHLSSKKKRKINTKHFQF